MAFNFGNWLEEAWANVNPFDNGATAKTVVAARKRKAAPAVTPAQTSSPTRIGGSNQLASPKAVQLTMPKTPTISTTKLMNKDEIMAFNFGNRKKNLAEIDAIQKKAQADIWDPAKIAGDIGKSVGQVASGAAKGVVDAGTGMINDYGKRVADTGEAAATVIRQLNGENQAFDKHMQDLATNANQTDINVLKRLQTESDPMKRKQLQKVLSLDARGTAINSMQNAQQQQLQATDPRKTLVNAGNTALDVLTLGKGKAILDGVRATQKVTAPVLRQLAKNTALSFLQGAGIGAAYSGVNTAIDPNASPLDYARNMGQGAAMGAAVGLGAQVVFPVAGVAAKQAVKGTESAIVRSANYGLKPPTNLSKDELYIASKVRQAREGYISPQDITVQEAAIYQNVQRKLGAKPGTPDGEMAVVHALGAHRNFDTQRTLRKDATLNALEKSSDFTRQHLVPGGTLMGVKAKGFKDAKAKGLVFDGVDGKPRFEVDDSGATAKTIDKAYKYGKPQKLADLIDHPQLFENYPDLARTEVSFMKNVPEKFHADYNPQTGTINLNDKFIGADGKLNPKGVAALLHETQHGIQAKERFAMGADLDGGNKAYWNSAGEAEARAVQARMNMPMSERYVKGKQYYHGSPDADKIRKEGFKIGERTADKRAPVFGDGVYMTTIKDAAEPYAKRGAFKSATGEVLEVNIPENLKLADVSVDDAFKPKVIERLKKQGYDGVRNDDIVNIFDPKKVNLGKATPRSTFYDSLDVPKKDLIIRNGGGKAMSIEPKDPLAQLKQEALKYKSAEEFVRAQGSPLYRGGHTYDQSLVTDRGVSTATSKENAQWFAGGYGPDAAKSGKTIEKLYLKPDSKILNLNDVPKDVLDGFKKLNSGNTTLNEELALVDYARKQGYDAIDLAPWGEAEVRVINKDAIRTKQQLTDLYNQAHAQSAPVKTKPRVQTQTQTEPLVPSKRPPVTVAQADGGGTLMPQGGEVALPTAKKTTRYASKTIPQSEFVGEQVKTQTKKNAPEYTPETERGRYSQTLRSADQMGFDKFENDVQARLQSKHIDSQTVADSQAVAQRLEAKGDDASLRRAADIYDKVSEHLTKSGQTIQAAAIMARRTPEGMKYQALKDLRKAGVEITPEVQRTITAKVEAIAKTKPQTEARAKAIGELAKDIEKKIPTSTASNLVSVWKAGLLSGVKTTQGNIISNATFGALKKASDPVTLAADTAMSFFTKKYSTTGTYKGLLSGTKEGTRKGIDTLKTGIDTRTFNDKYELHKGINFKNKTVQKYVGTPAQKVFDFMGAQDQPFYFAQLKNSLYDLAEADGRTKGLSGSTLRKHMDDMVQNPTDEIMQRATDEANKAVLAYDTVAFKAIQSAKQGIQNSAIPDVWKSTGTAAIDVLAPFIRVPTAFLSRALDFTPVGVGREAITQIATKKFDQRALSQAIGEGVTGTGVIVLGAALTNSGQISGDYPDDPKEQQRWKAEGIQPNSVKLGDTWYSLNYLGPIGMLMGAGKKFVDAGKEGAGAIESVGTAIGGFGQTLLGQSFLQGLSGFMEAMNDPDRYLKSFVTRQAGSIVPSISNDFANLMDGYKRETNTALDGILSRIPGLRNTLEKSQDVYGNKLEQGAATDLIGVRPSDQKHSVVLDEVSRLHKVDENNTDYQVTPTTVDRYISINGERVKLSDKQRYDLQEKVGQATQNSWLQIIKSDEYKKLSDLDKAAALNRARLDVSKIAQSEYAASNGLGKIQLTKRQASLAKNGFNLANYTSGSSQSLAPGLGKPSVDVLTKYDSLDSKGREKWFASENDAEYKYYKAKYENDKANGEISKIEDIRRQKMLKKDEVGAKYTKDTRDLYSLSKAEVSDYLSSAKNGNQLAKELIAYDEALYNAGLVKYKKFRYGFASSSGGGRSRGGRKSSRNGAKKFSYSLSEFAPKKGTSKNKQLYDLLKEARKKYA